MNDIPIGPPMSGPLTREQLIERISLALPDNAVRAISPEDVRTRMFEMVPSFALVGEVAATVGPPGPAGAAGSAGPAGATGTQGGTGPTGPAGAIAPVIATGGDVARPVETHVGIRATISNYLNGSRTAAQAFNAAAAYLKTRGGGVLDLEGKPWTFDGESLLVNGSYIVIDAEGCACTLNYTGGPSILFGDATAQIVENGIVGGRWIQGDAVNHPLVQLRWQRGFYFGGRFYTNKLHSIVRWGLTTDGISKPCSQLTFSPGCEVNQRNTGPAGHGIDVQNAIGALHIYGSFEGPTNDDGVLTGFGPGAAFIHFDSANPQARFDWMTVNTGIAKGYDYGIDAGIYRVVNVELGVLWRFDDCGTAGVKIGDLVTVGQGAESWNIHCHFGGFTLGRHIDIVSNSTAAIANIKIRAVTNRGTAEALSVVCVGANVVRGLLVDLWAYDWKPASAAVRLVLIAGDVNGKIENVHLKQEAGTNPDVLVEDTTPSTSELSIFRVTAERAPNTAYLLRTNAGGTALRQTGTGTDGLPAVFGLSGTYTGTLNYSGLVTFTGTLINELLDDGAGAGPTLQLKRTSLSPAASDLIGRISFTGKNSTPATFTYAQIGATILDPVAGTEDASITIQTAVAGTLATRWLWASGGHFQCNADNAYDIGASGSLRPRSLYLGSDLHVAGNAGHGMAAVSSSFAAVAAGTTAKSQLRLVAGVAPSAPTDGDIWFDGAALKIRIGGVTKTFTVT